MLPLLGRAFSKAFVLVIVFVVIAGLIAGFLVMRPEFIPFLKGGINQYVTSSSYSGKLVIFCAGSLYLPLQQLSKVYELTHPGVRVYIEPSGSVAAVRKVTDLGERADVLAVADYRLIPKYMMNRYAEWVIGFATNRLVIVYTNESKYSALINSANWMRILLRPDVRFGFSNPNDDPCGYRAVTVLGLASLKYGRWLLDKLLLNETNIKAQSINGTINIYVPPNLKVTGNKIVIRSKSVDLIALVESGVIDYAFEYKSVAIQHKLNYVELPDELSLNNPNLTSFYSRVTVHIMSGTSQERGIKGSPIIYGVTIPSTAKNVKGALGFIRLMLSPKGKEVFNSLGQSYIKPILVGEVPQELR